MQAQGSATARRSGRKPAGSVVERRRKDSTVYALRFRAYGNREYETLGSTDAGWTRTLAEQELERRLAEVRLGQYIPPEREAEPTDEPEREPTFREFAWRWFEQVKPELRPGTAEVYRWHIELLLPHLGELRLSELTVERVDRYRQAKVRERDAIREARARGERTDRKPLVNETINKTLVRLGQILEHAVEYGYLAANPARGKRRKLKADKPQRAYLDTSAQIVALLDAARDLDAEARRYRHVGRYAMVATLVFAGLRLGELLSLRWRDVDLASGWLRIGEATAAKTDAGTRRVKIRPVLHDVLAARKAGARDTSADALVFGTTTGARHSKDNARDRVFGKAVTLANARLEERGEAPLPEGLTPKAMRRTFASVLYAIGEPPPVVMQEMGHTDPGLALRIYALAMRRDESENERLRGLVNGSLEIATTARAAELIA